jgi:hypothetical protein
VTQETTAAEEPQLKLDKNPSAKEEAKDFQNPDERLQAANNAHQLAVLREKKGWIGIVTGSTNESLNTGIVVFILCAIVLAGSLTGSFYRSDPFNSVTDYMCKALVAVVGYIFGANTAKKE